MATLRKDGRYQARITAGVRSDGKPIKMFFYGASEDEAEEKASNYYNKYVVGQYEVITFKEYSEKYLIMRSRELAQSTIDSYETTLKKHITPYLEYKLMADIKISDIKKLFQTLDLLGIGDKTKVMVYIVLSLIFKEAAIDEIVDFNLMLNIRKPKYKKKEMTTIPINHFWLIYETADQRMKTILYLAWCTGLRVGEIAGLQKSDINDNLLTVRRSISKSSKGLIIKSPKSNYGLRKVPIPIELSDMLKAIKSNSVFLFPNSINEVQSPDVISKTFSKLCKKLGYDYHFHQIRHTHATMLAEAGIKPKGIQQRLGHHSALFSLDVYTHNTDKSQDGIAELEVFKRK
ncbi:MAG: integrase family protein [Fusobacteria bacterium]|nr:MAG: integrase family protein [Fusobacteriota bacterium]KAF0228937.1 MAG: integrase family [Fusobacteriota bacterium]